MLESLHNWTKVIFLKIHIQQEITPMTMEISENDFLTKNKARNIYKMIMKVGEYHIYSMFFLKWNTLTQYISAVRV